MVAAGFEVGIGQEVAVFDFNALNQMAVCGPDGAGHRNAVVCQIVDKFEFAHDLIKGAAKRMGHLHDERLIEALAVVNITFEAVQGLSEAAIKLEPPLRFVPDDVLV
ncbi:MAG: hypothetical protein ETSY2_05840 [Candidatus Entotheonella gemina]|uniref:Uncharacterized protein n=1 Tax=Candidatus Entotheonella gemina TaxID=1429439 RepID=W4MEM8_9BACT|nr:MAG: hypothetical protein ETSY2_05840 [Candidatus Entotheonella gemina]